jgi:hypothetical protein
MEKIKIISKIASILAMGILLSSCEKEIELDLNSADPKYVIEAELPQNEVVTVNITKTVNFSDSNVFPKVKGAVVSITDNSGVSEQLIETADGQYKSQKIKGEEGKTYTLNISVEGKNFIANSTMPKAVLFTGVKANLSTFAPPGATAADNYTIFPQFIDPAELGNSYRFIQTRNGELDKSILVSNDNVGNGQPNARPIFSQNFEIKLGDEVTIEMRCIDKPVYDYFFSLNSIQGNGPGGGTTPTNPVSNFTGGALGYFSAFTVQKISKKIE